MRESGYRRATAASAANLKGGGPERRGGKAVVYGVGPVRELLRAAPRAVRLLCVRRDLTRRFGEEIEVVRRSGGAVREVDDFELARLAGPDGRHQGLAAILEEYRYAPLEELLETQPDPLLVVDGVNDPRNLGALMRSLEGAGGQALILARDRTVAVTAAVIKASAGAWAHLKVAQCVNVARTLRSLKDRGYWIAALAPDGTTSLYDLDASRRLALVVGSEATGVREIVRKTADFVVRIPMRGKTESLNVAVATAVALFEISRRRMASTVATQDARR